MNKNRGLCRAAVLIAAALCFFACSEKDPAQDVLDQRARWNVQLLSFAQDGATLSLDTRLSGPPNSTIESFTVRAVLLDADDAEIATVWHSFDLTRVERGGPKDVLARVQGTEAEVFSVRLDPVFVPTDEEKGHLVELQGLTEP
ncbi:MAG: hypothetical protein GY716_05675 [bacterium]|nr:hypothetical protein [bacterium]